MAKKRLPSSKQFQDKNQKLEEPNSFLETQKDHKNWYNAHGMGKQLGKPRAVSKETKKAGGVTKHSLRKEK